MKTKAYPINRFPTELVFWCLALIGILLIDTSSLSHFTLCPLGMLGIEWCPGCGLGRSMKFFIQGDFMASWKMHPLGGLAWGIILFRMVELIKLLKNTDNYG
ncbi:hypothetical protein GCM10028791_01780 [Echinicola sediminis]